jgi:hypothetical protein
MSKLFAVYFVVKILEERFFGGELKERENVAYRTL